MIKYIGSKRKLVPVICELVDAIGDVRTACDLFTGTTRVAQALKARGIHVVANDLASYSQVLAEAYVAADADVVDVDRIRGLLAGLAALPDTEGYFTRTFCEDSRFLQPHNGRRVDAIRHGIDELDVTPVERAILLTSLLEAADRVDSTTGLQMAYLKQWSPRSHNALELRVPALLAGSGEARREDANQLVRTLAPVDLCYVDPPYNQHSYFSNYHVWETLVRGDEPDVYGIACKRVDCRTTKSAYNSKPRALETFTDLVRSIDARHVLVSFNDEGYLDRAEISELLGERGEVGVLPVSANRYVGARIGIHDPKGRKVGAVSHVRNTEFLFLVGPGAERIVASVQDASGAAGVSVGSGR